MTQTINQSLGLVELVRSDPNGHKRRGLRDSMPTPQLDAAKERERDSRRDSASALSRAIIFVTLSVLGLQGLVDFAASRRCCSLIGETNAPRADHDCSHS